MLTVRQAADGIVTIQASGELSMADYDSFVPAFERIAEKSGPLRILVELQELSGWTMGALWEDLKFDTTHRSDFGRVAIVGNRDWQNWAIRLSKPFFKAEMRYFDTAQADAAKDWLKAA